ncbi:hypothetical protein L2747_16685 [Shewanella marinintestina]|nr:hypothetical protein [Shewanella marinintestina]MCL1147643.1 hypothetical protein [Shewanella marinintestina]
MSLLTKTSLLLAFSYFFLWCAGPLWLQHFGTWYGLPLWFWLSCIAAPILLIVSLSWLLSRMTEKHND